MSKSDLFAYLAAFVTIILALALSDMIHSLHRLLMNRGKVKWDLLTPLMTAFILMTVVSCFFSLWDDARFDHLTFYGLLWFMVIPILTALAAFAVLPDEVPAQGLDLRQFYMQRRRYLAGLLALLVACDVVRGFQFVALHRDFAQFVAWRVIPLMLASLVALAIVAWNRWWWAQLAALVTLLVVAQLGYAGWVIKPIG